MASLEGLPGNSLFSFSIMVMIWAYSDTTGPGHIAVSKLNVTSLHSDSDNIQNRLFCIIAAKEGLTNYSVTEFVSFLDSCTAFWVSFCFFKKRTCVAHMRI